MPIVSYLVHLCVAHTQELHGRGIRSLASATDAPYEVRSCYAHPHKNTTPSTTTSFGYWHRHQNTRYTHMSASASHVQLVLHSSAHLYGFQQHDPALAASAAELRVTLVHRTTLGFIGVSGRVPPSSRWFPGSHMHGAFTPDDAMPWPYMCT